MAKSYQRRASGDEISDERTSDDRSRLTAMRAAALGLWLLCLVHAVSGAAQEWPQFRGPDGQGHATGQGLPIAWSESQNVAWKVPVPGRGWSSPVVGGGRVWLTTATAVKKGTSLRCLKCKSSFDPESVGA